MLTKDTVIECLHAGLELRRKDIGICDLRNTNPRQVIERKYQVFNSKECKIYNNISEAIDRFLDLLK